MKKLDVSARAILPVTGFLPESRQVLLELKKLDVQYTALSKKDLRHLLFIVHNLPELRVLNLSGNTLKGCLARFILDHYQGLPHLEELHMESTKVNKRDLQCISKITQSNKLPKLKILDLSHNILTECLSSFLQDPHPGLPELKEINLCDTSLSKKDLQELFHITQRGKLPKLQVLDLSQNILTGYLTYFLPDTHLGLNELERLYLRETSLNKEDLQHLLHITQSNKLPKAQELVLYPVSYNDFVQLTGYYLSRQLKLKIEDQQLLPKVRYNNKLEKRTTLNKKGSRDPEFITA